MIHQICSGDPVQEDRIGGECNRYGREEKFIEMWMGKSEAMLPHGRGLDMVENIILTEISEM
jgi:hypothetical protein